MGLDAATVLLQWATGGLAFLWVTTRRREVGLGYGWLMRGVFGLMAAGALAVGLLVDPVPVRDVSAALVVVGDRRRARQLVRAQAGGRGRASVGRWRSARPGWRR